MAVDLVLVWYVLVCLLREVTSLWLHCLLLSKKKFQRGKGLSPYHSISATRKMMEGMTEPQEPFLYRARAIIEGLVHLQTGKQKVFICRESNDS